MPRISMKEKARPRVRAGFLVRMRNIGRYICKMLIPMALFALTWIAISFLPGCGCASEAMGSVWMGNALVGCGVLVGFKDGDRTRIAFVTARHVATCLGLFRRPSNDNAVFLKANGRIFCHRKIANIDPSRWFCAAEGLDFAWFELTENEIAALAGDCGTPRNITLQADGEAAHNAVASFDDAALCALRPGKDVSVAGVVYGMNGAAIRFRSVSHGDDSILFTWSRTARLLEESRKDFVKSNHSRRVGSILTQNVIGMGSRESFSGAPVFMQDDSGSHLVGMLVSSYDKAPVSGYQSFHSVASAIRASMVSGEGLQLIKHREFW